MIYYEAISRKNLPEYRDVILPDIYEELSSFREEPVRLGYLCIGAREEASRQISGAIITELEADEEEGASILILSIFVRRAFRRQGIGSTLISRLLTVASGTYLYPEGERSAEVTLKIQYVMQRLESEEFSAFLRDFGFTEFAEEPPMYRLSEWELFDMDLLRPSYQKNKNARPFSEAGEELRTEVEQLIGRPLEPELSFAYVRGEDILGMVLTEEISPGHYFLTDAENGGALSDTQMTSLLRTAAVAIEKKTPRFTITMQPIDPLLKGLLMETPGAVEVLPMTSWVRIELEKDEETDS